MKFFSTITTFVAVAAASPLKDAPGQTDSIMATPTMMPSASRPNGALPTGMSKPDGPPPYMDGKSSPKGTKSRIDDFDFKDITSFSALAGKPTNFPKGMSGPPSAMSMDSLFSGKSLSGFSKVTGMPNSDMAKPTTMPHSGKSQDLESRDAEDHPSPYGALPGPHFPNEKPAHTSSSNKPKSTGPHSDDDDKAPDYANESNSWPSDKPKPNGMPSSDGPKPDEIHS